MHIRMITESKIPNYRQNADEQKQQAIMAESFSCAACKDYCNKGNGAIYDRQNKNATIYKIPNQST